MSVAWRDGLTLTIEGALSAATGDYGAWDSAVWDTDTWGPDELFVDLSAYPLRRLSTDRHFGREVQAWEAGAATLVLDNRSGDLSPDNLSGPFVTAGVTEIRPWRAIRVNATFAGVTYPVYRGYALDWLESWPGGPNRTNAGDAIVTVPCTDELGKLAGFDGLEQPAVGAGELFGTRIHRLLNNAGHVGERAIEAGTITMQATTLAADTSTELKLTADSEGGAVYIDAAGTVVGEQQYALVQNSRSINVQATFGDGGGTEIPYTDPQLSSAGDQIINIASYARVGSTTQTVADATSRALYGDKRDTRTDLICESDAQTMSLASWKVARFKAPERRIKSLTIKPRRNPVLLFPIVLGLKVRDLVRVKRRPPGGHTITQDCFIAGIAHTITPDTWETVFTLSSATPYTLFSGSLWDTAVWDTSLFFY